jgi:hypothetical protein
VRQSLWQAPFSARHKAKPRLNGGVLKGFIDEACLDTNTARVIHNPTGLLRADGLTHNSRCPALIGIGADQPAPIIVRRAPFADIFHMPEAAQTDLMLVQPAKADAR